MFKCPSQRSGGGNFRDRKSMQINLREIYGTVRMCPDDVLDSTDPRRCRFEAVRWLRQDQVILRLHLLRGTSSDESEEYIHDVDHMIILIFHFPNKGKVGDGFGLRT